MGRERALGNPTYGFPSGPRTTPGGKGFVPGAGAVASVSTCGSLDCSTILEDHWVAIGKCAFFLVVSEAIGNVMCAVTKV